MDGFEVTSARELAEKDKSMKNAHGIALDVWCKLPDLKSVNAEDGIEIITKALLSYGRECREEALGEAAKILKPEAIQARENNYAWVGDRLDYLAEKIRSLKSRQQK